MTLRITTAQIALMAIVSLSIAADPKADALKARKGLQEVGEFIGQWNLQGETKATGKLTSWKEKASWGWKFKGDDAWIALEIQDAKYFSKGELRYDPSTKKYSLTITDQDATPQKFVGEFKRGKLTLERKDSGSGDVHRLTMNTLSDGVRLLVQYDTQPGGRGIFNTIYKSVGNKEGESFAGGGAKKPECIVTGGAGTISVSYMGKTYYVCCSGCRDEFNDNPKKYVDAFEKGKK